MFEKAKKFYRKHKKVIIITIGGVAVMAICVLLGKKLKLSSKSQIASTFTALTNDDNSERALLESYGAVFKEGYGVPFATKEVVDKFIKERGQTYQIDILDDLTSVVWISQ